METSESDSHFIPGVVLTPLKIIEGALGDVMHGLQASDSSFHGFGEVYFSTVNSGAIKSWRRHREMILNLFVPQGEIRFVLCDDRHDGEPMFQEVFLSLKNYQRLTIPPMIWIAFQGISSGTNLLMDLINLPHDDDESEKKALDEIKYAW